MHLPVPWSCTLPLAWTSSLSPLPSRVPPSLPAPQFGQHGKWIIAIDPFNAAGGVAYWDLAKADEVTDAVLYPEVCTRCNYPDGKQEWCQCDRTNAGANLNTIETRVEGSITPSMRGVAIAFSIFAPLILIVYTLVDRWYYNKYGKTFQIARVHVH